VRSSASQPLPCAAAPPRLLSAAAGTLPCAQQANCLPAFLTQQANCLPAAGGEGKGEGKAKQPRKRAKREEGAAGKGARGKEKGSSEEPEEEGRLEDKYKACLRRVRGPAPARLARCIAWLLAGSAKAGVRGPGSLPLEGLGQWLSVAAGASDSTLPLRIWLEGSTPPPPPPSWHPRAAHVQAGIAFPLAKLCLGPRKSQDSSTGAAAARR
jgi:hypothetical protein